MGTFWNKQEGQYYGSELKFISLCKFVLYNVLLMITICIYGQSGEDKNKSQYLFPDFAEAMVKLKAGNKKNAIMNYNTVTEKMVFKKTTSCWI